VHLSTFRLPARSSIWKAVRPFGYPDWTELPKRPKAIKPLPPLSSQPKLLEANVKEITVELDLEEKRSLPFKKEAAPSWTAAEREKARVARAVKNLNDLQTKAYFFLFNSISAF
jgi:hypothetical protein